MLPKTSKPGYEPLPRSPPSSRARLFRYLLLALMLVLTASLLPSFLSPKPTLFGLMIDAGSTGSRIHTYAFHRALSSQPLRLLHEDFFALKPGLSAHKDDPAAAARSLVPLLERAMDRVPPHLRAATPVVLRATAGLRMIGEEASGHILTHVRTLLRDSQFRFDKDEWASILAGNEEAVYSWVTVNYLLDRAADDTVGTLEMGGGSSQIAYVPRAAPAQEGNCSTAGEKIAFKGAEMPLYTMSHLHFGLQEARAMALDKFEAGGLLEDNACINAGATVEMSVPFNDEGKKLAMSGSGDYGMCRTMVDEVLLMPAMGDGCGCDVCTYRGAAQPKSIGEYVAIAFYLERTVALGMKSPVSVKDMREMGEKVCKMNVDEVMATFANVPNGVATDLCFDLAFIVGHLEKGHGITEGGGAQLMVMDKINDVELGWCLGAMQQTMEQLGVGR